jgi:hypothetical protein
MQSHLPDIKHVKTFVLSFLLISNTAAQTLPSPEYVVGDTLPTEMLNRALKSCDFTQGTSLAYELSDSGGKNELVWLTFFGSW